mmetsp:Transcript_23350/g.54533  ORF Transcript_23350/g.54533 Transcript_23350/m.54533 type:complete len:114 (-) Transcript_23350:266-607(-)
MVGAGDYAHCVSPPQRFNLDRDKLIGPDCSKPQLAIRAAAPSIDNSMFGKSKTVAMATANLDNSDADKRLHCTRHGLCFCVSKTMLACGSLAPAQNLSSFSDSDGAVIATGNM